MRNFSSDLENCLLQQDVHQEQSAVWRITRESFSLNQFVHGKRVRQKEVSDIEDVRSKEVSVCEKHKLYIMNLII